MHSLAPCNASASLLCCRFDSRTARAEIYFQHGGIRQLFMQGKNSCEISGAAAESSLFKKARVKPTKPKLKPEEVAAEDAHSHTQNMSDLKSIFASLDSITYSNSP